MTSRLIQTISQLERGLSEPRLATVHALAACPGDLMILGAGGKMGPTLAGMAIRAARDADGARVRRVIAVSRFSSAEAERGLDEVGVQTIQCDLLDRAAVSRLPDVPNIVFMAGQKFGTTEAPERTWQMNVVVPEICTERFAGARFVAFSTGNVYPLTPATSSGSRETDATGPIGEYAASCLGRERVFERAALHATHPSSVAIVRLNYAIDLRYGVLADIATRIQNGAPVSLAMGHVNVIWQGDANRAALELLPHAASPARIVNVTGLERLSVRWLATELGARLGRAPVFEGTEAADALLSDASLMQSLVGAPEVAITTMLDWTAEWTRIGGARLAKPTHFDVRDGKF